MKLSKSKSKPNAKVEQKPASKAAEPISEPLFKYSCYKLDIDAEPLWQLFLPSEEICDYRILFTLTNFLESDPPICVYNSDSLLDDQLQMQMNLFLNDSIYAEETLYLPKFLTDSFCVYMESNPPTSISNVNQSEIVNLISFLIKNVNENLKKSLKGLLEHDSIESFGGENIDLLGRKELSFAIERIPESTCSALVIEGNYDSSMTSSGSSWYRREINRRIKEVDLTRPEEELKISQTVFDLKMEGLTNFSRQQLNTDCLEYIQKNSPLISNSLAFLFDPAKREEFFVQLIDESETDAGNSLNRFIKLYVPLDYMKHLSIQTKLDLITQFLLTNKTEESKIELIIDLANYYAQKQEWNLVLSLLNNCMQDNEELNEIDPAATTSPSYINFGNIFKIISEISKLLNKIDFKSNFSGVNR